VRKALPGKTLREPHEIWENHVIKISNQLVQNDAPASSYENFCRKNDIYQIQKFTAYVRNSKVRFSKVRRNDFYSLNIYSEISYSIVFPQTTKVDLNNTFTSVSLSSAVIP
jgi:hypothetical protein